MDLTMMAGPFFICVPGAKTLKRVKGNYVISSGGCTFPSNNLIADAKLFFFFLKRTSQRLDASGTRISSNHS